MKVQLFGCELHYTNHPPTHMQHLQLNCRVVTVDRVLQKKRDPSQKRTRNGIMGGGKAKTSHNGVGFVIPILSTALIVRFLSVLVLRASAPGARDKPFPGSLVTGGSVQYCTIALFSQLCIPAWSEVNYDPANPPVDLSSFYLTTSRSQSSTVCFFLSLTSPTLHITSLFTPLKLTPSQCLPTEAFPASRASWRTSYPSAMPLAVEKKKKTPC